MSRLKRNLVANYAGGAWTAIVGIAFVPFYITYLGIEAYGLIGFYISLQAWLVIIDMGFTPSLNREMARFDAGETTARQSRELIRTLELIYLFVTIGTIALFFLVAPWVATNWLTPETLTVEDVSTALVVMGITVAFRWLSSLYRGAMMGLQRQVWLNGCNVVFATLRGAGVLLVLEFYAATLEAFFLYQGALYALECLAVRIQLHRILPPVPGIRFRLASLHGIWRFALGVASINILGALLTQLDKIVLSALMPLSTLGYYTLASTVAGALMVLVNPVSNAAFPRFTESMSANNTQALRSAYRKLTQLLAAIVVPASCVIAGFSGWIILLWTRDATLAQNSGPILSVLILGSMLNGVMNLPYNLQLASGWTRLTLNINTLAVLLYVPLVATGIHYWGAIAPAWFWLGLNVFYILVAVPLMHRVLLAEEKAGWYRNALLLPVLASVIVVLAARWLLQDIQSEGIVLQLIALAATLAITFAAAGLSTPLGRSVLVRGWNSIAISGKR